MIYSDLFGKFVKAAKPTKTAKLSKNLIDDRAPLALKNLTLFSVRFKHPTLFSARYKNSAFKFAIFYQQFSVLFPKRQQSKVLFLKSFET